MQPREGGLKPPRRRCSAAHKFQVCTAFQIPNSQVPASLPLPGFVQAGQVLIIFDDFAVCGDDIEKKEDNYIILMIVMIISQVRTCLS